ncbi:MAG: hypothetical protein ABUT20_63490 [Bacteroidota bacterium]
MVNLNKKSIDCLDIRNYGFAGFLFLLIAWVSLMACKGKKHKKSGAVVDTASVTAQVTKGHYDLSAPQRITLGEKLHEISGISFISDHIILGENDEHGKIFSIDPTKSDDTNYPSVRFGDKGDYEDIVVIDTTAYLLISDGEIVEVRGFSKAAEVTGNIIAQMGGKHNEFESLYYDKSANSLIMLCKSCHHEKDQMRTAYKFDLTSRKFSDTAFFTISIPDVAAKIKESEVRFFPSAAAIQPVQDKVYIITSIGKLLVIADKKGKVEEVYKLDPSLFNQPEGITFAPNGDMFISNEGGDGKATLLKFTYRP